MVGLVSSLRKAVGLQIFYVFPWSFKGRCETRFPPERKQVLKIAASVCIQSGCLRTILISVHQTVGTSSLIIKMLICTGHLKPSSACHKQILRANMYSLYCGYLDRKKRVFKFSYKTHPCLYSFLINPTKQMCAFVVSRVCHRAGCLLPACQHVVVHDSLWAVSPVVSLQRSKSDFRAWIKKSSGW